MSAELEAKRAEVEELRAKLAEAENLSRAFRNYAVSLAVELENRSADQEARIAYAESRVNEFENAFVAAIDDARGKP